jgi:hypothetical protein
VKKALIIITLVLFSLSTLVMPYANYDDVTSLQAVYHNCLNMDGDTNFVEFIAENFLSAGMALENDKEDQPPQPKHPDDTNLVVQIQTGTLYQQPVTEITLEQPLVPATLVPVTNTDYIPQDYRPGIFHPPAHA